MPGCIEDREPVQVDIRNAAQLGQKRIYDAIEMGECGMIEHNIEGKVKPGKDRYLNQQWQIRSRCRNSMSFIEFLRGLILRFQVLRVPPANLCYFWLQGEPCLHRLQLTPGQRK